LLFFDGEKTDERERAPVVLYGEKMQAVKITVCSSSDVAGEEKLEVVSFGTLHEKNGSWYARYQESETDGTWLGPCTTIKWDRERIIVLRSGGVEHRQEFYPRFEPGFPLQDPGIGTIPHADQDQDGVQIELRYRQGAWQYWI
jgi:hypothetical protein